MFYTKQSISLSLISLFTVAAANAAHTNIGTPAALDEFIARNKVAVVKFSIRDCAPCRKLAKDYDSITRSFRKDEVAFAAVSADQQNMANLAYERYKIASFPTIVVFVDGQKVASDPGYTSPRQTIGFIRRSIDRTDGVDRGGKACGPQGCPSPRRPGCRLCK